MELTLDFIRIFGLALFYVAPVLIFLAILIFVIGLVVGKQEGWSVEDAAYYAFITATTVGYGDLSPQTPLGKALASFLMITGYGIIAVPTGIVTVGLTQSTQAEKAVRKCSGCGASGHETDADFCRNCGKKLP